MPVHCNSFNLPPFYDFDYFEVTGPNQLQNSSTGPAKETWRQNLTSLVVWENCQLSKCNKPIDEGGERIVIWQDVIL